MVAFGCSIWRACAATISRSDEPFPVRYPEMTQDPAALTPRPPRPAAVRVPAAKGAAPDLSEQAVRLNKRMADLGLCSRRQADDWIARGWVRVDGQPAVLGLAVPVSARIEVDPQARQRQSQQVTILLNKPVGYVSAQAEDGHKPAVSLLQAGSRWQGCSSPMRWSDRPCWPAKPPVLLHCS